MKHSIPSYFYSLLSLWPGFVGLLRYGRWSFLSVALLFALQLDLLLVANFYWTEYLSTNRQITLLAISGGVWLLLYGAAGHFARQIEAERRHDGDSSQMLGAISHYLQANWFETECSLHQLLAKNPRDVESLLLLATMYRHTKRYGEALQTLETLEKFEESGQWLYELAMEKQFLNKLASECENNPAKEAGR